MKYRDIITKVRKVINSCDDNRQLRMGGKFCILLIEKSIKIDYNMSLEQIFNNRKKQDELHKWLFSIIKKKKCLLN